MYFRRGVFYETPHIVNYIDKELQPLFKEKILYGVKQIYRGEKEYKKQNSRCVDPVVIGNRHGAVYGDPD